MVDPEQWYTVQGYIDERKSANGKPKERQQSQPAQRKNRMRTLRGTHARSKEQRQHQILDQR